MISTRPNTIILPINIKTNQTKSKDPSYAYNWQQWAKASMVFAGTVATFLAIKSTGSFSLLSKWAFGNANVNEQEDDKLTLLSTRRPLSNAELISTAVAREQRAEGLKLVEFDEKPSALVLKEQNKRAGTSLFPEVIELSSLDGTNGFKLDGEVAGDKSGISVSHAGDVNGDGIDDLIIGAMAADPAGDNNAGRSYIVFGNRGNWLSPIQLSNLDGSNGVKIDGEEDDDNSGISVSGIGDINGDNIADLIVGAYCAKPSGKIQVGRSYVLFGHNGTWSSPLKLSNLNGTNGFKLDGEEAGDASGHSVSGAGDINGDNIADLIIGASGADPSGRTDAGRSYVVFGHTGSWISPLELSSLDGSNGFKLDGEVAGDGSGVSVSAAGDVNGDNIADLIIGAFGADLPIDATGRSYVVFGHTGSWISPLELSSLDGSNGFKMDGEAIVNWSGVSVSSAGDVNGDNIADLIIGAHGADPSGRTDAGRSYVVFGHTGNWSSPLELSSLDGSNGFKLDGEATDDFSGMRVSSAGDVNSDNIADLIIGAYWANPSGRTNAGRSYVVFGHTGSWISPLELSSLDGSNGFKLDGAAADDESGISVSSAGDVNGDNIADLIIGAREADPSGRTAAGQSYVVFGGAPRPELKNNSLTINENETVILNTTMLRATDWNSEDNTLTFIVSDVRYGQFEFVSNPGVAITSFTQQRILDSAIQFVHDGRENAPSYKIMVTDGYLTTTSSPATITFTNINDYPMLINNDLTINEGQTAVLTANNFRATDEDNADVALTFIINNLQHGQFEELNNSTIITEFSQQEIIDGNIQFIHDGSELAPSFNVTVTDSDLSTPPTSATITFTNINDAPELINNNLIIAEGQNITLTPSHLSATDVDNADLSLSFIANHVHYGQFELITNPNVSIANFTQQQIIAGEVQFIHDGNEIAPRYDIMVNDGQLITLPSVANITFTNINDAPILINNHLAVNEGQTVVLTANNLSATDEDDNDASLTFIISNLQYGEFETVNNGTITTEFSQQEIIDGNIQFVHDGSELAPSFNVSVTDGDLSTPPDPTYISFNHVYDGPSLVTNNLNITEGQSVILNANYLNATDVDTDDDSLTFIPSQIQHGQFSLVSNPDITIHSFMQQQVRNSTIQFSHDGGEIVPSYVIAVSDGHFTALASPAVINFTNVNDQPVLLNHQLTINEGQAVVLTSDNLSATDEDNSDSDLIFTVSNVQHGQFEQVGNPGIAITSFTQQQVMNKAVQFVHDGDEIAPSFAVSVSDGDLNTAPVAATINFNSVNDKLILVNNNLSIVEGQTVTLTSTHLSATDVDNADADIIFSVTGVQHGRFELISNPGTSITSFTQQQIIAGALQFVHDGGEIAPSYDIVASDGDRMIAPTAATITFTNVDDIPVLENNKLTVNKGETIIITPNDLSASDVDNNDANLTFMVSSVQYGQFELVNNPGAAITTFTQQQIMDGAVQFVHDGSDQAPNYNVAVSDGELTTTPTLADITFRTNVVENNGLSTGAIAGIVAGGIGVVSIAAVAGTFFATKRCQESQQKVNEPVELSGLRFEPTNSPY